MKLVKIFIFFQFFIITLLADVNLYIKDKVVKGEPLVFTLEISGNEIKFPDLSLIEGNSVQEISSSISTNVINSEITKVIKKSYSFIPTKDFIFPSLEFEIDGKKYHTDEKNIILEKASKTKSDIFDLSIKTDKKEFYVGENFILKIVFKHKKDLQIVGLALGKPNFENFWYKQIDDTKRYEENDFSVIELKFLMTPLKEGNLTINPMLLQAQVMDDSFRSFFSTTKDVNIYSNELNFDVKALPSNIKLVGDFEIETTIDKQKVKHGEAISYKLKIKGTGNIDDIPDIKLPIKDVTIYENKPEIKTYISNDKYEGTYEKVYSIIPNKSFTIPSINFEFFDKEQQKVISKTTKSYDIEVEDAEKREEVVLEKAKDENKVLESKEIIVEKISFKDRVMFFIFGVLFTVLVFSIYFYINRYKNIKKEELKPLSKKVKETKTKTELIKILAVYMKIDSRLDELIYQLEKVEDVNMIKKQILKILKELKL